MATERDLGRGPKINQLSQKPKTQNPKSQIKKPINNNPPSNSSHYHVTCIINKFKIKYIKWPFIIPVAILTTPIEGGRAAKN